jgi:hypothetical protein
MPNLPLMGIPLDTSKAVLPAQTPKLGLRRCWTHHGYCLMAGSPQAVAVEDEGRACDGADTRKSCDALGSVVIIPPEIPPRLQYCENPSSYRYGMSSNPVARERALSPMLSDAGAVLRMGQSVPGNASDEPQRERRT